MKQGFGLFRWAMAGLVGAIAAFSIFSCRFGSSIEEGAVRRIILVVVDTMRGDFLGCAGGPIATPNLDALAAKGVRFSNARAHIPITGPSHSSLFTGLLPSEHGVLNNTQALSPGFETLPELARDHGMKTAAFISLGVLQRRFGFGQGFDLYDQRFKYSWERNAGEINDVLIPWIKGVRNRHPFFLWAHYSDPHAPYAAPGRPYAGCRLVVDGKQVGDFQTDGITRSFPVKLINGRCVVTLEYLENTVVKPKRLVIEGVRTVPPECTIKPVSDVETAPQNRPIFIVDPPVRFEIEAADPRVEEIELRFAVKHRLSHVTARREYGHEVEYVDSQVGRLMEAIESRQWAEDSLIVFASDHGEGVGDHGHVGHIDQLYDTLLHVPLIMVAEGRLPQGKVVDQPVSLIDVLPTIAELVGFRPPEGIRGRSLMPLMKPDGQLAGVPHVSMTARPQADSDLEAVVVDGWKLIRKRETGEMALFDLGSDPGELIDVAQQHPDDVAQLNRVLDEQLSASSRAGGWVELDAESRSRLEALGYVN